MRRVIADVPCSIHRKASMPSEWIKRRRSGRTRNFYNDLQIVSKLAVTRMP
jgi:hypothetical protein